MSSPPTSPWCPPGLNTKGLELWCRNRDKWPSSARLLYSEHFTSDQYYYDFMEELRLAPIKESLLDGVPDPESIDPVFLHNLSKTLSQIKDSLDDKADKEWSD